MSKVVKINDSSMNILDTFLKNASLNVIGKKDQLTLLFSALIAKGHVLIEDSPGMGKTTLAKSVGDLFGQSFNRIQFTNDLLPSDVIGYNYFNKNSNHFEFNQGPIFTNLLLADEINRGTPKTQSAFLQAMEEGFVTVEGTDYQLNKHFMVIATQNPTDQVGVYELPESQLDRFAVSFTMGSLTREEQKLVLSNPELSELPAIIDAHILDEYKASASEVILSENLVDFILDISSVVKDHFNCHVSIRPSIDIQKLSRALAFLKERDFVIADDIVFIAPYVFSHRVMNGESIETNIQTISELVSGIKIPTR